MEKEGSAKEKQDRTFVRRNVWWLSLTSLFTDIHSEMIMPILPFFMRELLGASYTLIGMMEGLADGVASALKILSGYLSDRYNRRKPFVVIGYISAWLAKLFYTWAPSAKMVVTLRVIDRIGKGLRTSPRDALLADSIQRGERGRAFGLHRFMDTSGAFLGTLFTIGLLALGWSYPRIFLIAAIPGLIACFLVMFKVKEHPRSREASTVQPSLRVPGTTLLFIFSHSLFSLAYLNYALVLLLGTQIAGLSEKWGPVFYLGFNFVYAFSALGMGRLADRFDDRAILCFGYLMFVLMYGIAWLGSGTGFLSGCLFFAIYGVGVSAVETLPRSYLGKITPHEKRGTVIGWYHGIYGAFFFLGNTLAGWLWESFSPQVMVKTLMIVAGVTLIFFLIIMKYLPPSMVRRIDEGPDEHTDSNL